ncbi:toxin glutamine deamidase domain-containing protein [Actinoplanes sp. TRM 88003]|uniref:Toxin glutamine deamidase domain-containing protein n=1 Tax=Paractinoplanes aksuensis TaxID=2939490 RepID=A0ABT1DWP4_9ACTN|nr:toxin glutamine deamidase domain-containing protein [Actinoplanes aksuensis]MCO8275283.1 toxin glutamine deamidase domain-containing protein [Actinoplanes aksuensis]
MTVLPSPIPHPLEFSPFDVPAWAYEALEWVVGFDWPAGNEVATWDVADRWFSLATSLAEPNEAAISAAGRFLSGYGGTGITADGFADAWQMVAGDDNAPLHDLLRVSGELGKLVEGCGADLEAAKIEAWIEIGIFLIELVGMAVTVALTLGVASPAAGGLIVATRLAIQQIFRRLVEQLGTKALKQTAGRAIKQVTSREGLKRLGRQALDEGFDEAREEIAINGGIQTYQQSTGRSDGYDLENLGRTALAGFAGGAASTGAHAGSHGHGGMMRGAGGEVMAEFGAAATFGELPDATGIAKSASSGAVGAGLHGMPSSIDIGHLKGFDAASLPSSANSEPLGSTTVGADLSGGSALIEGLAANATPSPIAEQGPSLSTTTPDAPQSSTPSLSATPSPQAQSPNDPTSPSPTPASSTLSTVDTQLTPPSIDATPSSPPPSSTSTSVDPQLTPSPHDPMSPTPLSLTPPSPSVSDGSGVLAASVAFADPLTTAPVSSSTPVAGPPLTSTGGIGPAGVFGPLGTPGSAAPGLRRSPLSDLERIADALGPRPAPRNPVRKPETPTTRSAPPPEIRDERAYFGYAAHARETHEQNRRDEYAAYLGSIAEDNRARILDLGRSADQAARAGFTLREAQDRRQAFSLSEIVAEIEDQITQVRSGALAPDRVEVDPPEWARINNDVGHLAPGGVRTGDRSALDGFAGRPPIDRTRHYNSAGGLRPPLAVHQTDIENAVPRDSNGNVSRLPDPREGTWFRLANDGGPAADPTRGLNCVDGTLALFDTYIHGRPRVSAPRTFDAYANGNPDRPLGGEVEGINRIRLATGGDFQNLCPHLGDADPTQAKPAMDQAVQNLTNHLLNTGHGSYAFLITDLEGGGSHSWAALNQNGTVLYVDPQIGRISENAPLYHHHGVPTPINVVSLEALVVNASGHPTPLPHHAPGAWSAQPPTGTDHGGIRPAFDLLTPDQQTLLSATRTEADLVAQRVSDDLGAVVQALDHSTARLVGEEHRVKSVESLSRKFLEAYETENVGLDEFINRVKDRVRFSVETPEENYGRTVTQVLAGLRERGYERTSAANFWANHGRHNGLNIWLTTPEGFRIEVQFPTPLSQTAGSRTHDYYEIVRLGTEPAYKRVSAFLDIIAINKELEIYAHRPPDLHLITDVNEKVTTLAKWLQSEAATLSQYKMDLQARGISFETELQRRGLGRDDVPGLEGMGLIE